MPRVQCSRCNPSMDKHKDLRVDVDKYLLPLAKESKAGRAARVDDARRRGAPKRKMLEAFINDYTQANYSRVGVHNSSTVFIQFSKQAYQTRVMTFMRFSEQYLWCDGIYG